eukprot:353668-Chlamydomonas_euryale.AAC.5
MPEHTCFGSSWGVLEIHRRYRYHNLLLTAVTCFERPTVLAGCWKVLHMLECRLPPTDGAVKGDLLKNGLRERRLAGRRPGRHLCLKRSPLSW